MYGKRKLAMLLTLVFIMMFFILITISYASNTSDIINEMNLEAKDFISKPVRSDEVIVDYGKGHFYHMFAYAVLLLIESILFIVNIVLIKKIEVKNIISFLIIFIIMIRYIMINAAELSTELILVLNLIWQLQMLIYNIKQRIKAKNQNI